MRKIIIFITTAIVLILVLSTAASANTYSVKKGDTIFLIAQKFGISQNNLLQANSLSNATIYPGQALNIPSSNSSTKYTVQPGDSLYFIGKRLGVDYNQIAKTNNLNSHYIYPGQTLKIPSTRSEQTASRGISSWREVDLLAKVVNGEARGEPFIGQVAVAAVVLNRVKSNLFPNSISDVVYQPWAFTATHDGQINAGVMPSAVKAAQAALDGWDPSGGALYYWNPITATNKWVWTRNIMSQIGGHVFAK